MEMDEEMEVGADVEAPTVVFEACEVDVGYEFDASMCFDFTRAESRVEGRLAELWFESAKSYPPSTFVANLFLRESILLETFNSSQELGRTGKSCGGDNSVNIGSVFSVVDANNRGTTACKSLVPKSSTLMKPTASQLAKQNLLSHSSRSRFRKLPLDYGVKGFCNSSGVASHAIKKQKLDGGFSLKVIEEQPIVFSIRFRERSKISNTELVHDTMETRRFKARPLNRKVLEALSIPLAKKSTPKLPEFHEFRLKISERATQNSSAVLSNSSHCSDLHKVQNKLGTFHASKNKERERSNPVGSPMKDGNSVMQNFKARPLNRKIFLTKGDINVFRNTKREAIAPPMEFNLHAEKKIHLPPSDLFSRLSLKSNLSPENGSKMKLPRHKYFLKKDLKENRSAVGLQTDEMMPAVKQKPLLVENRLI